jgi:predicted esterase
MEPLARFRDAAEKYGYIIASSNNSMSDDPTAPNLQAMKAMWDDTHQRFSIDERRLYATGFSGGARIACNLAIRYSLAGVIGCGAGFPGDQAPAAGSPFVYFGTIGLRDFNFYEMRLLETRLQAAGMPHRIRAFDGEHEWPPASVCAEAIEWMEMQAMKKELRPRDAALIQAFFDQRMAAAKETESAGKAYDAATRYREIAADFDGLQDASAAAKKAEELAATETYRATATEWARKDKESLEFAMKLASVAKSIRDGSRVPALQTVKAYLDIDNLKKKAADESNVEESLHASRLLYSAQGQAAFYMPRAFFERGEYEKAALALSLAVDISPEAYWSWYQLACAYAQMGETKRSLEALSKAVETGFQDADKMQNDFNLKPLREEKEFRKLAERLRKH